MIDKPKTSQERIDALQRALTKLLMRRNRGKPIKLINPADGVVAEDDWVYLIVKPEELNVPSRPKPLKRMLADDYVNEIGPIEIELRKATHDSKVLLVPAIPG